MAGVATPELVAAVSGAGGLGSLGSAMLSADELRGQAEAVRKATDAPFAINFFCHTPPELDAEAAARTQDVMAPWYDELGLGEPPDPAMPPIEFDDGRLAAALDVRPAAVSFHLGAPENGAVQALHDAGVLVLASATTVGEARHLESVGVDVVVAQGAEAGGHRGSFLVAGDDGPIGTLALVPQVVDAVSVPVVAAGGIADGRGLAAALALGAAGVQMGTAFLACPEAAVHPLHRRALSGAAAEETAITRAFSGRPARALRNRLVDELPGVTDPLPFPIQFSLTGGLGRAAAERGSADFLAMWAGQAAPLNRELGAAALVWAVVSDAGRVLASLAG